MSAAQKQALALQQQQLDLQRKAFGLAQTSFDTANVTFKPALNYWQDLLQGGQAAMNAVGPSADLVRGNMNAAYQSMVQNLPRGGERNLAVAQNTTQGYSNLARLYAGVQPTAANAISQIASAYLGVSPGFVGGANIQPGAGINAIASLAALQSQQTQSGAAGMGNLLYRLSQKGQPSSSG